MEKTQNEILEQLRTAISSIREQLDILESKVMDLELSALQEAAPVPPAVVPVEPADAPADATQEPASEPDLQEPADMPEADQEDVIVDIPSEEPVVEDIPAEEPAAVEELLEERPQDIAPSEDPAVEAAEAEPAVEDMPEEPAVEDIPVEEPAQESEPAVEDIPVEEPVLDTAPVEEPVMDEIPVPEISDEPFDISLSDVDIDVDAIAADFQPVDLDNVIAPDEVEKPAEPQPQPAVEPEPVPEVQESPLPAVFPEEEDEPVLAPASIPSPQPSINDIEKPKKAVMDVFSEKLRWKTDMPGTPVKNIVSAISLNDRALFINTLFRQNPLLFTNVISSLNVMGSFEEALAYLAEEFPEWNLKGDSVYRFMMAVRRKLK